MSTSRRWIDQKVVMGDVLVMIDVFENSVFLASIAPMYGPIRTGVDVLVVLQFYLFV
jgi:hypothetical protein